jgi:hypothetical protein
MQCPPEIAEVLLEIIYWGLLRIRTYSNARRSQVEADHLHNLPELLTKYSPANLDYYWTVERPIYIARSMDASHNEPMWERLAKLLPASKNHATTDLLGDLK